MTKHFPRSFLLAALLLPATVPAQGFLFLWQNANFTGSQLPWPIPATTSNAITSLGSFGDQTTSLQWSNLPANIAIDLYQNADGSGARYSIAYNAARTGSVANVGATYNDSFSSLSVHYEVPSQGLLRMWDGVNFTGNDRRYALSSYAVNSLHVLDGFQDTASSFSWADLPANVVVWLYENADGSGHEFCITHDAPRTSQAAVLNAFDNDKWSSWRWRTVDPAQGRFTMYEDKNFLGRRATRYLSELSIGATYALNGTAVGDDVDSLQWSLPSNRTVILYDDNPAGGKRLALVGNGGYPDLVDGKGGLFHDMFSAFQVLIGSYTNVRADRDAPLDQVCQLASHNAFANLDEGWVYYNHKMSTMKQLDYGARLIDLDVGLENGTAYLMHGTWSQTLGMRFNQTPPTLASALTDLRNWLLANPSEVVWLQFENNTGSSTVLPAALTTASLDTMMFTPTQMRWPSINQLASMGKRLIVTVDTNAGTLMDDADWYTLSVYDSYTSTDEESSYANIDGMQRSIFVMNHIDVNNPPIAWLFGITPNTYSALLAHALSFPFQRPNFVQYDVHELGGHPGLDVCTTINETQWSQQRASTAKFQARCDSSSPTLKATTRPILGQSLITDSSTGAHIMTLGFSDTTSPLGALPFAMNGLAGCDCTLRNSLDGLWWSATGAWSLPIPASSILLGFPVYLQSAAFTSSWKLSNGLRAVVGAP